MNDLVIAAWEKIVRRCGDSRAIVEAAGGKVATFRELDQGGSAWLEAHAAKPAMLRNRTVVFARPNGIAWFELFLGLLKAGAIAVPLDAGEPPAAQRQLAVSLRADFWWDGTNLVALKNAPRPRDTGIFLIKLTSGTTGRPRPLRFTGAQLLADASQIIATMGLKRSDLNYALIPFGHSYGLGNLTVPLLAHGVPLVCGSSALPHAIGADFARWMPSVFPGVPAMWRALAMSDVALKSLRLGISAGAALPPQVAQDFASRFGRRLHNFYGSSETGGIAYDVTGRATLSGGVGRAIRGVKLKAFRGARLKVESAAVFTHGNRQRTEKSGAWIMADRVALNPAGEVTLLGRRGQTVKVAGRRVNLSEVTARLRQLNGVREVWVGLSDGPEPALGAVVVTEKKIPELRAALLADTPSWKIPKKWVSITNLPLTARGKPDRHTLQKLIG